MDREKEAAEQAAFNASTHRRRKKYLLRTYIDARVSYFADKDAYTRSMAGAVLVATIHELQLLRFSNWRALRKHSRQLIQTYRPGHT